MASRLLWAGLGCDSPEPCAEGPVWLALASRASSVALRTELQKQSWQQRTHRDLPNQAWRVTRRSVGGQGRAGLPGPR